MKNLFFILTIVFLMFSCKNNNESIENIDLSTYKNFGATFEVDAKIYSTQDLLAAYQDLLENDTLQVIIKSTISEVCQTKGCWMTFETDDDEVFIKFKDYEFFVPLNAHGSEAVVKGKAYKKVTSVEALRHYAEDAGKSEEEILAINEPEIVNAFMADGVYIKKSNSKQE